MRNGSGWLIPLSLMIIGIIISVVTSCSYLSPAASSSPAPPNPSTFVPPPFTVVAPTTTVYVTVPATQSPTPTTVALEPINDAMAMIATLKLDTPGDPNYGKDSELPGFGQSGGVSLSPLRISPGTPQRLYDGLGGGIVDIGPISQLSQITSIPGLDWDGNYQHSPWHEFYPEIVGHGYLFTTRMAPSFDVYACIVTQEIFDANNQWIGVQVKYALLKHFSVPQISVTPGPSAGQVTVSWTNDPYIKKYSVFASNEPRGGDEGKPRTVTTSSPVVVTVRTGTNTAGTAYFWVDVEYPWSGLESNVVQASFK